VAGVTDIARRIRQDRTLRREADMMGITVCIVLLVALTTGSDKDPHSRLDVLTIVWATTIALALTHWFAVLLSMVLVDDPSLKYTRFELLVAQLGIAVIVAIVGSIVVLVVPQAYDRFGARMTAAVCLGLLVGIETRRGGRSVRQAVAFAAIALVIGSAIAYVKLLIS
jgi:membrane-anchored protein YejM (alkaline phosphatase superfamily)